MGALLVKIYTCSATRDIPCPPIMEGRIEDGRSQIEEILLAQNHTLAETLGSHTLLTSAQNRD